MTKAIMLDLETLSSASDAAITQIAAVVFDLDTGELGPDFDVLVKSGPGRVGRSTSLWWMQQKGAAEFAARVEKDGAELREALLLFSGFVAANKGLPMFAHGATFDFPVSCNAYAACGLEVPWSYRDQNCCRPFYRELGGKPPEVPLPDGYLKHDALSDCKLQIAQLVEARRQLGLIGRSTA